MINSTLQTQENTNIATINNEREIEIDEDGNSGQVEISENKCSVMPSALRCYLIYSVPSSHNHTFALTFYVSSFASEKCFHMFAPVS